MKAKMSEVQLAEKRRKMKRIRKYVVFLMAFALFMQAGLSTSQAAAAKKAIKAKSLSLNYKKKTIQAGKTLKLKATVKPKKVKAKIKWASSNKKVATVSANGKVKAKKKGVAKITAAVKGTKLKKTCKITVKEKVSSNQSALPAPVPTKVPEAPQPTQAAGPVSGAPTAGPSAAPATASPSPTPIMDTKVIATQDDVEAALADAKKDPLITTVKIKTEAAEQIELPEGDYSDLKLVIEAPKAEVSNHAVFKEIIIRQIAKDTYREYAEGNVINADCPIGRIIITDRAKAELNILKEACDIAVVVDGSLSGMEVAGKDSTIDISGSAAEPIKVQTSVETEIKTSHVLEVNASAKITLVMYPGAEDSEVYVDNNGLVPEVYGVGSIKVAFGDTGNVQTVIAEYRDDVSGEQQIVALEGAIVDYDSGEPRKGALVYLLPYTNSFDESKVEENEYRKTASTDENGKYTIDSIRTGNYIMVVKEPGMVTAIQYLVITSRYGGVFQNETLQLFPQTEDNAPGVITGTLSNSVDGNPIEGLTARLRKGKGNTVGNVLEKAVSDSQGTYTFEGVEPGYYTVEFVDLRTQQPDGNYISTSMNAVVRSGRTDVVSPALTKSISSSQVRFVLTWGDESSGAPADLDSHLTGPKKEGSNRRFHTYFLDRTFKEDDVKYADLDHDDTTWEGPETTTIYEAVPGVYDFYIHDFTNLDSTESTALATSGAKVEIYQGTTLMVTYYVPNKEGTVWHVCSYDSRTGTLEQYNEMYYESDPASVGSDPKQRALELLEEELSKFNTVIKGLEENDAKAALQEKYKTFEKYLAEVNVSDVSLEEIQAKTNELSKLVDKVKNSLYIGEIYFADDSDTYAEVYNEGAEITIYTIAPSDVQIKEIEVPEGVRYEIVKGGDGAISAIRVITEEGYAKAYKVTYEVPSYYFSISEVEGSDVDWWTTRTDYDEDDNKIYMLDVYTKDGNAREFTLTPTSSKVQTGYEKDADGVITSVTLSVGDTASRTYQVRYCFDEEQLMPSSVRTVSGEEIRWDEDWDYDDNDSKYYYITVLNDTGNAGDITVTPQNEGVNVTYNRENGAVTSFTMSAGGHSRTYQVRYAFDQTLLIPQDIVSDEIEDWDWDYDYDENDEKQYYLSVWTTTGEPCDFTVTPKSEKAEVSYGKDGDVIRSVTIKIGENTRTYQVRYSQW